MALKKYIDTGLANARTAHEESVRVNESTFDSIAHAVVNQVIRNTIKDAFLNEASRKAARRVTPDLPQCAPGYVYSRGDKTCVPRTAKNDVKVRGGVDAGTGCGNQCNITGQTGLNSDGYTYEEPFVRGTDDGGLGAAQSIGESKKCKNDDCDCNKCKKKRRTSTTILGGVFGYGAGHHKPDNDNDNNEAGDSGGGDGGGEAMSQSVRRRMARIKKKAKVAAACVACGYTKCRCDNPLERPFTL